MCYISYTMNMLSTIAAAAVFALALCGASPGWSQESSQSAPAYPVKPIRLIVPFTPAGGADFVARLFAPRLSAALGQPVIVENRPGASTIIGGDVVAKAPPDGHALFMATFTNAVNPSLYPKAPWDIKRDFVPVSLLATTSYTLAVHPSVPVKTPRQLVAFAEPRGSGLYFLVRVSKAAWGCWSIATK